MCVSKFVVSNASTSAESSNRGNGSFRDRYLRLPPIDAR